MRSNHKNAVVVRIRHAAGLCRAWRVASVAGCALLAALCALLAAPQARAAQETLTIALTTPKNDVLYANLTSVPIRLGLIDPNAVHFVFVPGGNAAAQLVSAGRADLYFGPIEPVFKSALIGGDLKAIYVMNHGQQYYPVVLEDSPIKTLADFRGKKLGVFDLGFGGIPYYRALLKGAGLDPQRDVTFVPVGQGAQALAALSSHAVDGLALWDTEIASMENIGYHFRKFLPPPGRAYVSSSIVTTNDVIAQKGPAIQTYLRAIAASTVFCLNNETACVRMHWALYPQTRPAVVNDASLKGALHILDTRYQDYDISKFHGLTRWGDTSDAQIEEEAQLMMGAGLIQAVKPAGEYFDRRFLDYANGFNAAEIKARAQKWSGQ